MQSLLCGAARACGELTTCGAPGAQGCGVATPCTQDATTCSTGAAAPTGRDWFCELQEPAGAAPNAAGELCFEALADCNGANNACNTTQYPHPCVAAYGACSTGQAAAQSSNGTHLYTWFCPADVPAGAMHSGGGFLCYDAESHCQNGASGAAARVWAGGRAGAAAVLSACIPS